MPTAPTLPRASARPEPRRLGVAIAIAIAVLAFGAAAIITTTSLLAGPDRIDMTIENPTAYEISVEVSDASGGPTHELGRIGADSSRELRGIVDQGDTWSFAFSYGGIRAAEATLERDAILDGPVVVPSSVETVLADSDLPPPPS